MSNATTALLIMTLKSWDRSNLATLNLQISGFGCVSKLCKAYEPALRDGLIHTSGKPMDDELGDAVSFEVNRRIDAGEWQ